MTAKHPTFVPVRAFPKRAYRKLNTSYWKGKTVKSKRFHARKELALYYAGMLGRASKNATSLYRELPFHKRCGRPYWQFVGLVMRF